MLKTHRLVTGLALTAALAAPLAHAHSDRDEPLQAYRQSFFALLGMNFGPLGAMVKGDIPWDTEQAQRYAADIERLTQLDLLRGFAPTAKEGMTRAKPAIWENMDDFKSKFSDLQDAAADLAEAAATGDRNAIAEQVKATGGACKACHDEYKAKDYLY
jgi:cytochrome c556